MTEKKPRPKAALQNGSRVTLSDIAESLGVSASTVSRVLSGGSRSEFLSEETHRKVQNAARQLGYTPNPLARALKGGRTNLIGLVLQEIADPFFAQLIQQLSDQARTRGYQIVLGYARGGVSDKANRSGTLAGILDTRHVDGVIVLGNLEDDAHTFEGILAQNHAVVALCRSMSPEPVFTVKSNNLLGVQALFAHLYTLGHRRFGFIEGDWLGDIPERRGAFLACMQAYGLPLRPDWLLRTANHLSGGYEATNRLLALPECPGAIMASDDTIAIGAMKALSDAGVSVPAQVSVTGYDDIEVASFVAPGLTTVRQPIVRMAEQAIEALVSLIEPLKHPLPDRILALQPELILRATTAMPQDHPGIAG